MVLEDSFLSYTPIRDRNPSFSRNPNGSTPYQRKPLVNPYEVVSAQQFDHFIDDVSSRIKESLSFKAKPESRTSKRPRLDPNASVFYAASPVQRDVFGAPSVRNETLVDAATQSIR